MKLLYPTNPFHVNQPFGANYNTYYAENGLKGHSGTDLQCSYGQVITSACDGYVYSVMNKDNPDLMRYRAAYVLYDDGVDCYEVSYGHAHDILVEKGQTVKAGDPIITGGNTGDVAVGGVKVTREQKMAGSTDGTHLHFQVRPLLKVSHVNKNDWPITTDNGKLKINGQYFIVKDYLNGYNGCVDPMPFFVSPFVFTKLLKRGMKDPEVRELQQKLNNLIATALIPDGVFGFATELAVKAWQIKNGLVADGVIGPASRAVLNRS